MTKHEYAALIRRTLTQATKHRGTEYGSRLTFRAQEMTKELRREVFRDRLTALITQFPKRISFGI